MALTDKLTAIGNAIREKNGTSDLIPLVDMPQAILDIESGGIEAIDHTVTFTVDGEPYEVVSVKDGNSVNAPSGIPTSEKGEFGKWSLNGSDVTFPYTPTEDSEFIAMFELVSQKLYDRFGVDRNTYPFIVVTESKWTSTQRSFRIDFFKEIIFNSSSDRYEALNGFQWLASQYIDGDDRLTIGEILSYVTENTDLTLKVNSDTRGIGSATSSNFYYTNSEFIVEGCPDNSSYFE